MDKLSEITKMQSDNQMRFSDLENIDPKNNIKKKLNSGTSEPQDLGAILDIHQKSSEEQETNSIGTTAAVTTSN